MPDLDFQVVTAAPQSFAASPLLAVQLKINNAVIGEQIQTVALRCQIQIEAERRRYNEKDQERLQDLFGEPARWSQTLRPMLWTHASVIVPRFEGDTVVDLPVPCTFDFNIAATKYFGGLDGGEIPLCLQFSGTVFYESRDRTLQVSQIPWTKETRYQLPVQVWKDMMEIYYPNCSWLSLRRDVFERLYQYKVHCGLPTWEQTLERLLGQAVEKGAGVNTGLVDTITRAVMYEGYMLYPYRPSAVKNRQRFNFGVISPEVYAATSGGAETSSIHTECVLLRTPETTIDVRVRFLHLVMREVKTEPDLTVVESLNVGGQIFQSWQEAIEREVPALNLDLSRILAESQRIEFAFSAQRSSEFLRDKNGQDGQAAGRIDRSRYPIAGVIEVAAELLSTLACKVTVRVINLTPFEDAEEKSRDEALLRSLVSVHTIVGVHRGEFVSQMDPPEEFREAVASCRNVGTWPVLVGTEGARDLMLSSPIILYDYPTIAPESAGDLFDGTEIDEILTLRILALTEDEKREMLQADPSARRILERTETLSMESRMKLHGNMRRTATAEACVDEVRSRRGGSQTVDLQVSAPEPPRRCSPPLLTQEGICSPAEKGQS